MKMNVTHSTIRALVVTGLALAASAAFCATGFTVVQTQEAQITAGMSRDDVRGLLGRPAHNLKYMAEPGRTWTYGVVGKSVAGKAMGENTVFDVDFSADGKVTQSSERVEMPLR
jgi:outer membrane protein assembly factor BamE (lipoprotein component of BamABCDE complex)